MADFNGTFTSAETYYASTGFHVNVEGYFSATQTTGIIPLRTVIEIAIAKKTGWLAKTLAVLLFDVLVAEDVDLDHTLVVFISEE